MSNGPDADVEQPPAPTTEEVVAQVRAAEDTAAWMKAPSIAGEAKAKTTEELVAEAGAQVPHDAHHSHSVYRSD